MVHLSCRFQIRTCSWANKQKSSPLCWKVKEFVSVVTEVFNQVGWGPHMVKWRLTSIMSLMLREILFFVSEICKELLADWSGHHSRATLVHYFVAVVSKYSQKFCISVFLQLVCYLASSWGFLVVRLAFLFSCNNNSVICAYLSFKCSSVVFILIHLRIRYVGGFFNRQEMAVK